eukprot:g8859.t1
MKPASRTRGAGSKYELHDPVNVKWSDGKQYPGFIVRVMADATRFEVYFHEDDSTGPVDKSRLSERKGQKFDPSKYKKREEKKAQTPKTIIKKRKVKDDAEAGTKKKVVQKKKLKKEEAKQVVKKKQTNKEEAKQVAKKTNNETPKNNPFTGLVKTKIEQKFEEDEAAGAKKKKTGRKKNAETLKWEEVRRKLQTDKNGNARYCFRRGCHKQCISTVLGGVGTHPFATVRETRAPFIQAHECFIAGNNSWNPWDPGFAGDHGLMHTYNLQNFPNTQTEFHYFRQCESSPWKRGYHGKKAAGAYLYLGKYKVDPETPVQTVSFQDLPLKTQNAHAAGEWKWYHKQIFVENDGPNWPGPYMEAFVIMSRLTYDEEYGEGEYMKLSKKKREILAIYSDLYDANAGVDLCGVKFVSYDEALYEKLVEIDAIAKNGEAQVEIEEDQLGRYLAYERFVQMEGAANIPGPTIYRQLPEDKNFDTGESLDEQLIAHFGSASADQRDQMVEMLKSSGINKVSFM